MLLRKEQIMPLTSNVSASIKELYHAKKKRKRSQIIAIALAAARRKGGMGYGKKQKNYS